MNKFFTVTLLLASFLFLIFLQACKPTPESPLPIKIPLPFGHDIDPPELSVGVAKQLITPPQNQGIKMSGYSSRTTPFLGVHDDLFVRAIVVSQGNRMTIHVSTEQLNIPSNSFVAIHQQLANLNINLPITSLFISATHTHGGPSVTDISHAPSQQYKQYRQNLIVQTIKDAYDNQVPANIKYGSMMTQLVNVNRQVVVLPDSCYIGADPSGHSDRELQFVEFVDKQGNSMASIVLFGVHSTVMGEHNDYITGDIAGYTSRYVEQNAGAGHISLWMMSGGGNQSPRHWHQPTSSFLDNVKSPEAQGNVLGSYVIQGMQNAQIEKNTLIDSDSIYINLQKKNSNTYQTRILYGIRFSDNIVLIATPFELFSQTVEQVKTQSAFAHTMLFSQTNGRGGYLPSPGTWTYGCYENGSSFYMPSAEPTFVSECMTLINRLK